MRPLLAVLPLAMLASCAPLQRAVKVPTMKVEGLRLNSLSLPSGSRPATANVTLKVRVTNPNAVPVRLANIFATVVLDGEPVGDANLPNIDLPANGDALQDANLDIPVTVGTGSAFLKVARGQAVSYRLDGTFTADLGALGRPSFGPFTLAQGVWKQAPILPF